MKPFFVSFFAFIMFLRDAQSQTLYVDSAVTASGNGSSWSNAIKSLGDALDSAHKNPNIETILVAKGTYYPNHYPYNMNSSMIGVEFNTGNPKDRTFHVRTGLEVYGGYPNGGGVRNVSIYTTKLKGYLYLTGDTILHVVLMDTSNFWTILNDTSILDGVTILDGHASETGSITINGNTINRLSGAGIYVKKGTSILNKVTVNNCFASNSGGGVYLDSSNTKMLHSIIQSNVVQGDGAGIFILGGKNALFGNFIAENRAFGWISGLTGSGGGMYLMNTTTKLINNVVLNNQSKTYGGGAYQLLGQVIFCNNTFKNNKCFEALSYGGAIMSDNDTSYLYNNIFWNNRALLSVDSSGADVYSKSATIIAKNNLFQLDSVQISTLPLATGSTRNLYKINPQFKGGTAADSLSIILSSPLIDKGDSTLYPWAEKLDFLLADRIQNHNIDLGAIETYSCISQTTLNNAICFGSTIQFAGKTLQASGIYKDTLTNVYSCDSIVTLNLLVNYPDTIHLFDTICSNQSYIFDNKAITFSGIYRDTLTNIYGCDSFVELTLTVIPLSTKSINASICAGSSYYFNNRNINNAGIYLDTFVAANGCDSIVTLNLTVKATPSYTINSTICKGMTYIFNGLPRSSSGVYKDTFAAANGCDSIVILNLIISSPPIITTIDSSDFSTAYSWRGKSYSSAGTYYDTSKATNKCDTIFKLMLSAKAAVSPAAPPLKINYVNGALIASIDSATSYQWYLCGPPMKKITGANKRTLQVTDKDKYTVVVTKNGKTDTAACASNSIIVSAVIAQGIICYPNPVSNKLSIELERKLSNVDIAIYDLAGRKLWGQHYNSLLQTEINMENLTEGTYFLKIQSYQVSNRVFKIVKKDE